MKSYPNLIALQEDLRKGSVSCETMVQYYLDRIHAQSMLNAFLEVFEEEALQRAAQIDQKIQEGEAGKLFGLVIALKDVICIKDHKISAASRILENFTSLYSASVTERLLAEDAIIIGRLNCDEFGMGTTNENSAFGGVLNFIDPSKVAGGSSGGAAVAVQADLCHAALGTDTGGSIRTPASFCGVIGLKPTYSRISRHGVIAYASSFDQVGVMAKSVEDTALVLEVIAGEDNYDGTASPKPVPTYSTYLDSGKEPKVAFFNEVLSHQGLDSEIKSRIEEIIHSVKQRGHCVDDIDFPYLDYIVPAYYILTTAEASSNLARYDGVHFGNRSAETDTIDEVYKRTRTEYFGKEVKRRIMLGTFVLSSGYYDAYYAKAQKVRRIIANFSREILTDHDFIIMPTTPTTAFNIGEKMQDPVEMYLADIFTVHASLAGLPAISLPLGQHSNGMPFGVQVMANHFKEADLLAFSKDLMEMTDN